MRSLVLLCFALGSLATVTDIPLTCYPNFKGFNGSRPILFDSMDDIKVNPCFPCWEPHDHSTDENLPYPDRFKSWSLYPAVTPSGSLRVHEFSGSNQTKMRLEFTLSNFAPGMTITAWGSYWYPFIFSSPHPYFGIGSDESAFVDADAAVSYALSATTQTFSDGTNDAGEANLYKENGNHYSTVVDLDYFLNQPNQGPMRNGRKVINQVGMDHAVFEQHLGRLTKPTAVGSDFLREFDPITGYQLRDTNGKAKVARSPLPGAFIAIVTHLDDLTHGINPGTAVSRGPGAEWTDADHVLLGIFDLRSLWEGAPVIESANCNAKIRHPAGWSPAASYW